MNMFFVLYPEEGQNSVKTSNTIAPIEYNDNGSNTYAAKN